MRLQGQFGTNPFRLGAAAGTDTHTGLSASEENNFWGKLKSSEPSPDRWDWRRLGAEQRAVLAERLWRVEQGLEEDLDGCRACIPWAKDRDEV